MKLFIDKDEEVKIEISVAIDNDVVECWPKNSKPDKEFSHVENHEVRFRMPTYKDNLLLMDSSFRVDESGNLSVITNQVKFTRFLTLLKAWTFKDDKGNLVPVNETTATLLAPAIVSVIIAELDKALSVG